MRIPVYLFITVLAMFSGCGLKEREKELEKRTIQLNEKEQQLMLQEKQIQLREEELRRREHLIDSTGIFGDSTVLTDPFYRGTWSVRMYCIETTCSGSAIGDIKSEQWNISYEAGNVIVKAYVGNNLVRIYTGKYVTDDLELNAQPDANANTSKMQVKLQKVRNNEMKGHREIFRDNGCKIVYTLDLKKQ